MDAVLIKQPAQAGALLQVMQDVKARHRTKPTADDDRIPPSKWIDLTIEFFKCLGLIVTALALSAHH
jgi:hypothetical protein